MIQYVSELKKVYVQLQAHQHKLQRHRGTVLEEFYSERVRHTLRKLARLKAEAIDAAVDWEKVRRRAQYEFMNIDY